MTRYSYVCEAGHTVTAPHPMTACPACPKGKPCQSPLKRVGAGSRTAAA